jgi:hypothetical protein
MTDYIKREDVHLALDSHYFTGKLSLKETIDSVPAADVVERKKGKWDKDSDMAFYWKCSKCGAYLFWRYEEFMVNGNPHFCPYCGAQMESEREDE